MAVSPLDQVFDPGELNDEVALPIADNTMWLALGTPFIDPSGSSDGAVAATMRRAIARVATTRRSPRQWIGRADDVNLRHWQRDRAIMDALGCSTRRTAPWTGLHPGDLVQLRVFLIDAARDSTARLVRTVERSGEIGPIMRAVEAAGQALVLADAAPFFVPAGIAAALMSSDPPDDTLAARIRLPFRSVFVFFDAIPLGDLEIDSNLTDSLTGEVVELGSSALVGVVLHAGPDGVGLDDDVYWILTNPIRDTYGVSLLPGLWRYSAQPGIVSNLAALCTWAQWLPPPPTPRQVEGEEGSRTWRRSLNRSSVRKALLRGAVTGVNVVDLGALHTTGSSPPPEQTSSSRSVRAHWRRGYWNSVRVATRDADGNIVGDRLGEIGTDWHYEGRWIHSVLVQGTSSNVVTVYAVPE